MRCKPQAPRSAWLGTVINLDIAEDGVTTLTVVDGEVDFYNNFGATVVGTSQQSTARPDAAPHQNRLLFPMPD